MSLDTGYYLCTAQRYCPFLLLKKKDLARGCIIIARGKILTMYLWICTQTALRAWAHMSERLFFFASFSFSGPYAIWQIYLMQWRYYQPLFSGGQIIDEVSNALNRVTTLNFPSIPLPKLSWVVLCDGHFFFVGQKAYLCMIWSIALLLLYKITKAAQKSYLKR